MAEVIFSYTGSPEVKTSQKVSGGYFFDSHCSYNRSAGFSEIG